MVETSTQSLSSHIRLALCLSSLATALLAQNPSAMVTGRISDPTGAAVPAATVMLTGVETGRLLKTESNAAGIYQISGLIAGLYRIAVSKEGFQTLVHEGIRIRVGETAALNYELALGAIHDTVTVQASAAVLDSEATTSPHRGIKRSDPVCEATGR